MTDEEAEKLAAPIIDALLKIPEQERSDVMAAIIYNGIFCVHCGYGSRRRPNKQCHCNNDE